jgi:hypothetical protein
MNGHAPVGNGFHAVEDLPPKPAVTTANDEATMPNVLGTSTQQPPATPPASNRDASSSENVKSTGRRNRKRTSQDFPMVESSLEKKPAAGSSAKKKKSVKQDDLSWICCECKEAEAMDDPESDLVVCEGSCHRPFHTVCAAGFDTSEKQNDDEPWLCVDCQAHRHQCSLCQEFGQDDVDVYCCKVKGCGLFFHESCLTSSYNVDIKLVPLVDKATAAPTNGSSQLGHSVHATIGEPMATAVSNEDEDNAVQGTRPEFKCPAHQCWTCTEEMVMVDETAPEDASSKPAAKGKKKKKKKKKQDNAFACKNGPLIVSHYETPCITFLSPVFCSHLLCCSRSHWTTMTALPRMPHCLSHFVYPALCPFSRTGPPMPRPRDYVQTTNLGYDNVVAREIGTRSGQKVGKHGGSNSREKGAKPSINGGEKYILFGPTR